eukprot:TRINITY_DN2271_c0_g1_i3.p2 TRINITY_DN2271_c0_g1~~TRINITY_DN2271_c0_g1_i3.p2  ORF type:complete len:357 (+),score=136.06 TRINITY_DN2271_c0_g1_i3:66-1073(+)
MTSSSVSEFEAVSLSSLRESIFSACGLEGQFQLLVSEGKNIDSEGVFTALTHSLEATDYLPVHLSLRLLGGKGGFGSLLRSKKNTVKTTNFGASRTKDGRRLRDVQALQNAPAVTKAREEAKKAEKEALAARNHKRREEALRDDKLEQMREAIVENVKGSLEEGLAIAEERRAKEEALIEAQRVKRKKAVSSWMPDGMDDSDSDDSSEVEEEEKNKQKTSTKEDPADEVIEEKAEKKVEKEGDGNDQKVDASAEKVEEVSLKRPREQPLPFDFTPYANEEALQALGLDKLKSTLTELGLKCGGTLQQRASRLWSVKGVAAGDIDQSVLAKKPRRV